MLGKKTRKEVILVLKCHLNQLQWLSLFLTQFLENKNPILNCNDAREESQE